MWLVGWFVGFKKGTCYSVVPFSHPFSCLTIISTDPRQPSYGNPPSWDERPHHPQTEGQDAWETEELDVGMSCILDKTFLIYI